jgi:hypothetical protein
MTAKLLVLCFLIANLLVISRAQPPTPAGVPDGDFPQQPIPANSTVRGRVFYSDTGRAVKRAVVMLINEGMSGGPGEATGLTDNNGYFEIKKVKAGTYYAMVNAPGVVSPLAFADFSKIRSGSEREAFADAFQGFDKIVVNGINDTDVQISARRGAAISGRVIYDDGDPAIGVKIEILRKVGDKYLSVIPNFSLIFSLFTGGGGFQTDDRGVYRFSGLPPGEYVIKATENATHGESEENSGPRQFESLIFGGNSFLSVFYPDKFDVASAEIVTVDYGMEVGNIDLTIPSRNLFRISGKIISRKDKSPVKARVSLQRADNDNTFSLFNEIGRRIQSLPTDEQGSFSFKELPKGKYKIIVEPISDEAEYDYEYSANTNAVVMKKKDTPQKPKLAKKIEEITIDDKDVSQISVELGFGATISGNVSVENRPNEMPRTVNISAISENEEISVAGFVGNYYDPETPPNRKLNRDFKLESVAEGKTKFVVSVADEDYYVKSMTFGATDLLAENYIIKEGENLANVKIVLGKGVGTLKGKVINEDKEPVKGARIMLVPTDAKRKNSSFYRNAQTDEKGEFEIKAAPMEYAVIIYTDDVSNKKGEEFYKWLDEVMKDAQTVKIEAGSTENITIKQKK